MRKNQESQIIDLGNEFYILISGGPASGLYIASLRRVHHRGAVSLVVDNSFYSAVDRLLNKTALHNLSEKEIDELLAWTRMTYCAQ
jgi:hypothetical protein